MILTSSNYGGNGHQKFIISTRGNEVLTLGVDYSGKIERLHRNGEFQVWVKHSGSCFSGRGSQEYVEPWVILVRIEGDSESGIAVEVEGTELNRTNSRSEKARLVSLCDEMGKSEPIHTPPPAKEKRIKPVKPTPAEIFEKRVQYILLLIGDEPQMRERIMAALATTKNTVKGE